MTHYILRNSFNIVRHDVNTTLIAMYICMKLNQELNQQLSPKMENWGKLYRSSQRCTNLEETRGK